MLGTLAFVMTISRKNAPLNMATNKHSIKIEERLFEDFFHCAYNTFSALESRYDITGVLDQIFGPDHEDKSYFQCSAAWKTLSEAFDYAVNGILPSHADADAIVINGNEVLLLATSEDFKPAEVWDDIIAMGDGRFAIDTGESISVRKLALLANVDVRTVKNAISAGELASFKRDDPFEKDLFIDNASARRWLQGRRGYKPTVYPDQDQLSLDDLTTPAQFGAFLAEQRSRLGQNFSASGEGTHLHSMLTNQALQKLEAGVFSLPLDAVFPIADLYLIDRKKLIQCVMRVFFAEELSAL
ncbi:hypothetical protein [Pseudaquabacterium rugosum]|uniref:Uncharacterized protein n=1 Tax=Pseudaquabacterium rugosum TaxID=2984194 RepID=A0ABU9BFS0_9BURK